MRKVRQTTPEVINGISYKGLELLQDYMYECTQDMDKYNHVEQIKSELEAMLHTANELLQLNKYKFKQTIRVFDLAYFKDIR